MARVKTIPLVNMAKARSAMRELEGVEEEQARLWYEAVYEAIGDLSRQTGYSREQIAVVIALYSINQSWQGNWTLAKRALVDGQRRGLTGTVDVPARVTQILDQGAPPRSCLPGRPKVPNFARSMLLEDGCAIDRWMYRAFGVPEKRPARYHDACNLATRFLARTAGLPPYAMQSLIWCGERKRAGLSPAVAQWTYDAPHQQRKGGHDAPPSHSSQCEPRRAYTLHAQPRPAIPVHPQYTT